MLKLKILLIGPCNSGKSAIANFLSDASDNSGGDYKPTKGVRIVEFETPDLNVNNRRMSAEVELWDCSGNQKFENCWPAMCHDAQGIILVYNPASTEHIGQLDDYYDSFVLQSGLAPNGCLLLAYSKQPDQKYTGPLSDKLARVVHVSANVDAGSNKLQADFNSFVASLISSVQDRSEQEELNIIGPQSSSY